MVNILSNLILCFILFLAVIFFIQLLKKIKNFDLTSEKISPFLKTILGAAETMSKNIEKLDKIAQDNKQAIQNHIPEAQQLRDDFDVLISISEKLALRLDESIQKARKAEHELEQILCKVEESRKQKLQELDDLDNHILETSKHRIKQDYEKNQRGIVKKIFAGKSQNQVSHYEGKTHFSYDKAPPQKDLLEIIKQLR